MRETLTPGPVVSPEVLAEVIDLAVLESSTVEALRLMRLAFYVMPQRADLWHVWQTMLMAGTVSSDAGADTLDPLLAMDRAEFGDGLNSAPLLRSLQVAVMRAVGQSRFQLWGRPSSDPFSLKLIPMEHLRAGDWRWWPSRINLPGGEAWTDVQVKSDHTLTPADLNKVRFADMRTWVTRYPAWVEAQPDGSMRKVVGYAEALTLLQRRAIWQGISRDTLEAVVRGIRGYKGRGWRDADPRIRLHGE